MLCCRMVALIRIITLSFHSCNCPPRGSPSLSQIVPGIFRLFRLPCLRRIIHSHRQTFVSGAHVRERVRYHRNMLCGVGRRFDGTIVTGGCRLHRHPKLASTRAFFLASASARGITISQQPGTTTSIAIKYSICYPPFVSKLWRARPRRPTISFD